MWAWLNCQGFFLLPGVDCSNACASIYRNKEETTWGWRSGTAKIDEQPFVFTGTTGISECVQLVVAQIVTMSGCGLTANR